MKYILLGGLAALVMGTSLAPLAAPLFAPSAESTGTEAWFDFSQDGYPRGEREIVLPEYPGTVFRCDGLNLWAEKAGEEIPLYSGMPIWSVYFCDLNGDGKRELCSQVSWGSGMIDEHIEAYDYAAGEGYSLWERCDYDYFLRFEDGELKTCKSPYVRFFEDGEITAEGKLSLAEDENGKTMLVMEEN